MPSSSPTHGEWVCTLPDLSKALDRPDSIAQLVEYLSRMKRAFGPIPNCGGCTLITPTRRRPEDQKFKVSAYEVSWRPTWDTYENIFFFKKRKSLEHNLHYLLYETLPSGTSSTLFLWLSSSSTIVPCQYSLPVIPDLYRVSQGILGDPLSNQYSLDDPVYVCEIPRLLIQVQNTPLSPVLTLTPLLSVYCRPTCNTKLLIWSS